MKNVLTILICFVGMGAFAQQKDSLPKTDSSSFNQTKKLAELLVKSKKPFIEQQADKTVVNVQADINAIGSSAFEILQKAPGISITGDDNINMSGKAGVNVMIDGRPAQMSSKELAVFLRGLPGAGIEKIELITNPSSRFDAQGNAGIINIRLKKNKIRGTNGNISAGYMYRAHYASNGSFSINHRSGKINAFANANGDNNLQHTDGTIYRSVPVGLVNKDFSNNTVDIDRYTRYTVRTGIDWYANKKNTFGFLFNTNSSRNPFNTPGRTFISSNGMVDSSLSTINDNLYKNRRYNTNLNYKFEDTLGNEWNVDADYTWFKNTNLTHLATTYLDKHYNQYNFTANDLDVATVINIYAVKAGYTKQLKKWDARLEAGGKISHVVTNNDLFATALSGFVMNADTGRSNIFLYRENIMAAYINWGQKIKKIEYQLGIRAENALVKGVSSNLRKQQLNNPDTSYVNIFPSVFISYQPGNNGKFALSFSKRINRPDYQSLNPFETIYDIYTSEKGNPYLRPQYTHTLEAKYIYKDALSIAAGFNRTKDYSQTISRQTGQLTTATPDNIGTLDNSYITISSPLPITAWWEGYINITGFVNHYKGRLPDGELDENVWGMTYYIQQNFKPGKTWNIQLSSWYNAPTTEAIFKTKSLGSLDLGIKKTILQSKASVRITFLDMLNTQRWVQTVQFAKQNFTYQRKWESRGIRLQCSWNFGKTNYKARERTTNADADRIKVK